MRPSQKLVWKERFGSIDEMVEDICAMFTEYNSEALEKVWQNFSTRYNQVPRARSGNNFEINHTGTAQR